MKFSSSETWKPIQTGIQLSTSSVLSIYDEQVVSGRSKFLMTSRLSQDALENVFNQVRERGDSHPSAVNFQYNIRAIRLSGCTEDYLIYYRQYTTFAGSDKFKEKIILQSTITSVSHLEDLNYLHRD